MKKYMKIYSYIGIALIIIAAVDFTVGYYSPEKSEPSSRYIYSHFNGASASMEPTFMVGKDYKIEITNEAPKISDIVEFQCLKGDCGLNSTGSPSIVHRLTAIDAKGCMTIIGDNPKYDWSKVPCYMPDDIKILGVVHKL